MTFRELRNYAMIGMISHDSSAADNAIQTQNEFAKLYDFFAVWKYLLDEDLEDLDLNTINK